METPENKEQQAVAKEPKVKDVQEKPHDDIRLTVRAYKDKSRRNRFRLTMRKEITLHKDIRSVIDEIAFNLKDILD